MKKSVENKGFYCILLAIISVWLKFGFSDWEDGKILLFILPQILYIHIEIHIEYHHKAKKIWRHFFFFAVLPWPTVCCCQWCRNHTLHLRHSIQGVKLSCRWIICCWSGVWLSQRQKYCFPSLRWQHHLTDDYAVQTAQKQMNIHKTNANDSVWPWMAS